MTVCDFLRVPGRERGLIVAAFKVVMIKRVEITTTKRRMARRTLTITSVSLEVEFTAT